MRKFRRVAAALSMIPSVVNAQGFTIAAPVDIPTVQSLIDNAMLTVPQPGSTIPTEIVGGTAGVATATFMRSDAKPSRITRSVVVTTDGSGNFSVTWSTALSSAPVVDLTWVNSAAMPITCELTTDPTTTTVAGRCKQSQSTALNLSIITAGLTLNPFNAGASGVKVHVIAIPPTQ